MKNTKKSRPKGMRQLRDSAMIQFFNLIKFPNYFAGTSVVTVVLPDLRRIFPFLATHL